jgi:hypothetical protein
MSGVHICAEQNKWQEETKETLTENELRNEQPSLRLWPRKQIFLRDGSVTLM